MAEKFNLKWNDFETNASSSFKILRQENEFFDVTLVSDDEQHISAHKLILSASSTFFKKILKKSSHSNPLIYLTGVSFPDLEHILNYIYEGEVKLLQENLEDFMDIAQKLKIKGLTVENEESTVSKEHVSRMKDQIRQKTNLEPKHKSYIQDAAQDQPKTDAQDRDNDANIVDLKIKNPQMNEKLENVIWKNGEVWECKFCGKKSQFKHNMKRHAEIHLDGVSDISCNECGKSFKTSAIFNNHKYRNQCVNLYQQAINTTI